ncbi:MAG TPA: hypothetical protein PKD86_08155 [Gemmatales bacterium]|nr:hypothetical protein [Gemmatales bacterium]HMP59312.1 hypothetical protein [Gemmatales bacterium]
MRVVIVHERFEPRTTPRQIVLGLGLDCGADDCVSFDAMPIRLAQGGFDLVLVQVGRDLRQAQQAILQGLSLTTAPIFAVGPTKDPQLILKMVRTGIRRYLDERCLREELQHALEQMVPTLGAMSEPRGRLAVVASGVPGIGVSTVAANAACALAEGQPGQVALAELGAGVPSLALTLDLAPRHVLGEVLQQWERLDSTMLRQAMCDHPAGVVVLAHPAETLTAPSLGAPAMRALGLLLRSMFDHVVVDLGHTLDASALEAMKLADRVLVVTRFDVPALRLTRRYVQQLMVRGLPPERLQLVANRHGQAREVEWKQAEHALPLPIAAAIPDDADAVNRAMNSGVPLIKAARSARITRSFAALAERLGRPVAA